MMSVEEWGRLSEEERMRIALEAQVVVRKRILDAETKRRTTDGDRAGSYFDEGAATGKSAGSQFAERPHYKSAGKSGSVVRQEKAGISRAAAKAGISRKQAASFLAALSEKP